MTQNEDIPDITHISKTHADLLEQNATPISETQHDRSKLFKDSGNTNKTIMYYICTKNETICKYFLFLLF